MQSPGGLGSDQFVRFFSVVLSRFWSRSQLRYFDRIIAISPSAVGRYDRVVCLHDLIACPPCGHHETPTWQAMGDPFSRGLAKDSYRVDPLMILEPQYDWIW